MNIGRKVGFCVLTRHVNRHLSSSIVRLNAKIIDGKSIAADIQKELKVETERWVTKGVTLRLVALLVGEDPASATYVANKMKAAQVVGIHSRTDKYPSSISEQQLVEKINDLNVDDSVDGILVQLPLPAHMNERLICSSVSPLKDVDGFHVINIGQMVMGMQTLIPCTPMGVIELVKRSGVPTFGKNAVVCGRSKNVGLPIAMMLHADGKENEHSMDATTTICHRYTPPEQLKAFTQAADIVVTATGIPHLIKKDMVKPGACVIDVGITRVTDPRTGKTRLVGDVDFENVKEVAGFITPVPGGVGPMTVTMLMKNTILAANYRRCHQ